VLDTGADISVIDDGLLPALRAMGYSPKTVERQVHDALNNRFDISQMVTLDELSLGGQDFGRVACMVLDVDPLSLAMGTEVSGILGFNPFTGVALEIDYRWHTVRIHASPFKEAPNDNVIPLKRGNLPVVDFRVGDAILEMIIDTGSEDQFGVPPEMFAALPALHGPIAGRAGQSAGGYGMDSMLRLDGRIQLGTITWDRPIISDSYPAAVIGAGAMESLRVVIDARTRRLIVSKPFTVGAITTGAQVALAVLLGPGDQGVEVRGAREGYTLESLGLAAGDIVLEIGGRPVRDYLCEGLASGGPGKSIATVTLMRKGRTINAEVPVVTLIPE
jgi:hypothetical protein